jgi:trimeric autotransporter adhesin
LDTLDRRHREEGLAVRTFLAACYLVVAVFLPTPAQAIWGPLGLGMSSDVYSITHFNGQLIVGGAFTQAGGELASCIAMWDGTSWSPLGGGVGGLQDPRVFALAVYNGVLIAGGRFDEAGNGAAYNIAQWNGTSWSPLGTGVNGTVYALTVYDGHLIAGGDFIYAGDTQVNCIARWDGSSWNGLGSGLECVSCGNDFTVLSLGVHAGNALIAGGWFNIAGGITANYIASWTGSWAPLGSGMDFPVSALIDYNGDLIAGGAFSHAGGQTATGIARWDGTSWSPLGQGVEGWYNWVRALTIYNGKDRKSVV